MTKENIILQFDNYLVSRHVEELTVNCEQELRNVEETNLMVRTISRTFYGQDLPNRQFCPLHPPFHEEVENPL